MTTEKAARWIDATSRRLQRAAEADKLTLVSPIHNHAGLPTGASRREVFSSLDSLFKCEPQQISEGEWQAGSHYLFLYRRSESKTRTTMKWTAHIDGWKSPPDPVVLRDSSVMEMMEAVRSVHPAGRLALSWLTQNEWDDIGLSELGCCYPGPMSSHDTRERGRVYLRLALNDLGFHFGFISSSCFSDSVREIEGAIGQRLRRARIFRSRS